MKLFKPENKETEAQNLIYAYEICVDWADGTRTCAPTISTTNAPKK